MRSAIGTNSGEPGLVTVATNSTIDRLAGPSFHEGSGSVAWATFARSDGCFMLVLLIELDSPLSGFSLRWKIGKLECWNGGSPADDKTFSKSSFSMVVCAISSSPGPPAKVETKAV